MSNHRNAAWLKLPLATLLIFSFIHIFPSTAIGAFIYDVNRTLINLPPNAKTGSVTGFIETKEMLGELSASDIINWNLNITVTSGGTDSDTLTPANSNFSLLAGSLIATPGEINLNTLVTVGISFAQPGPGSVSRWSFIGGKETASANGRFIDVPIIPGDTIATRPVPAPSAGLLLMTGLIFLGGYRWHHSRREQS